MNELDDILKAEELKWRNKSYDEIWDKTSDSFCYYIDYENKNYQLEIHRKILNSDDDIVVMVEATKNIFWGNFSGRARYFVKSKNNATRDIEDDEAF